MPDVAARRRRRFAAALGLLFAAGFGAGFAAGRLPRATAPTPATPPPPEVPTRLIREQGGRSWAFIDPLLECESAEEILRLPALAAVRHRVEELIEARKAAGEIDHVSVYFRALHDGPWFGIDAREPYAPASLLKLPVLIAVLKQSERDPRFMQQFVTFDGGPDLNGMMAFRPAETLHAGGRYTVMELCRRMVRYSDNNAARLLVAALPPGDIDRTLASLGLLQEFQAARGRLSVRSASGFFRILFNASYLDRERSELALEMLSHASFRQGLLAGIPGSGVTACSKYGEATVGPDQRELHEFALVYYPDHPYLLGVMVRGRDFGAMPRLLAEISRLVYQEVDAAATSGRTPPPPDVTFGR